MLQLRRGRVSYEERESTQADSVLTTASTVTTRPTAPSPGSQWARATTAARKGMCIKWIGQPSYPANN
jgi:hypothetical protein